MTLLYWLIGSGAALLAAGCVIAVLALGIAWLERSDAAEFDRGEHPDYPDNYGRHRHPNQPLHAAADDDSDVDHYSSEPDVI